ncbi:MAG: BON domain-containing protein, partial [Methylocella sp.]
KRNAEVEADSIRVVVDNDKVTLEGKVKSWYERDLAERAAWSGPGVTSVLGPADTRLIVSAPVLTTTEVRSGAAGSGLRHPEGLWRGVGYWCGASGTGRQDTRRQRGVSGH